MTLLDEVTAALAEIGDGASTNELLDSLVRNQEARFALRCWTPGQRERVRTGLREQLREAGELQSLLYADKLNGPMLWHLRAKESAQ
jgi:hypothetical protein